MAAARDPKLEHYRDPQVAAEYDRRFEGASNEKRNRRKAAALISGLAALARSAGRPLQSVLDAPCGTGRFAGLLAGEGLDYFGGELSLPMIAEARCKHPDAAFLACELEHLPLADGAVDAAVCIRFLHLVRDPAVRIGFLRELVRVVRLGVVLDYRHDRSLRVRGRRLRHRLGLLPRAPANPTPEAIRREIALAGLQIAAWIPVHRAPWLSDKVVIAAYRG